MTNQIMPKHSLETLATISKLKYFGHIMHRSYCNGKRSDVRTDRWQWKIRKTVYKIISRNMRNPEDELVKHLKCHAKQSTMEEHDLQGHEKQEMLEQIRSSKTQNFLRTQNSLVLH